MEAAVGHSRKPQAEAALEEALAQLASFGRADFALLFLTSEHAEAAPQLARRVREALGVPALLGGSTANVITAEGEHEGSPGLGILALRGVRAAAMLASDSKTMQRELAVPSPLHLALLDPDRTQVEEGEALLEAPGLLAGGGLSSQVESRLLLADEASGGVACALARLEGIRAQVELAQGGEPAMPFRPITGKHADHVFTIDGEPATAVLKRHLDAHGFKPENGQLMLLAALREPGREGYNLRLITGAVAELRAVRLSQHAFAPGTELAFAIRDTLAARRELTSALARIAADPEPVRALIYFNCTHRGALNLEPDADVTLIRQAFPGVPLLGMSSDFEIAGRAGEVRLHFYAGVLAALRDG